MQTITYMSYSLEQDDLAGERAFGDPDGGIPSRVGRESDDPLQANPLTVARLACRK
jgi:hypothetical protein